MLLSRRKAENRRGTAAVEAALVMPLMLSLMLGVWEVGRAVQMTQLLNDAARQGARMAAGGINNGTSVTVAMVQQAVRDSMTASGFPTAAVSGATITLTNLSGHTWTDPCNAQPLDPFRVSVVVPAGAAFNSVRWVPVSLISGISQLSSTVEWFSANDSQVTVSTTLPY
ncbi:MAG TPA: TadE/TadG family type IV pilus assembly protein [Pirellulales bacterium]|jgi:Flp pilus assembly protein TadG|nr:TadE/TadG family type IV pilus assembly protein [Pirellulales bacterium]